MFVLSGNYAVHLVRTSNSLRVLSNMDTYVGMDPSTCVHRIHQDLQDTELLLHILEFDRLNS
jgi:hypothetical protein